MTCSIVLPYLDPVAFSFGPITVRWYAFAYIFGIVYGYLFVSKHSNLTRKELDTLFYQATLGIIFGGRLGYVIFYNSTYYIANPLEILMLWRGGMSFHGGLLGLILALFLFSYQHSYKFFYLTDLIAPTASLGIFLGRIGNFVNAELYGRQTTRSWGVIFSNGDGLPRHPVQLYEGFLEGFLLFLATQLLFFKTPILKYPGMLSGIWLSLYGSTRIILENFREPDPQIGYFFHFITMGQILSLPMIGMGVVMILIATKTFNEYVPGK
ncbi:prolipoprotein diacylglyceryl transferase [Neorickettsia sennetsu]|uniref:Phosphatidylglycerol--prolipoprotein diacylglyceryl transferase n=1 Tax=Ehrlichia sennetsu (strain ATCC VR-367 / Miyayama) TaxID=222891 RepID=Q2GCS5_EHRS3|nr:prolipoprotein diacylglyceryl transferase [Neorickettsia sennetsu]ABD46112.1 prolipoprotein diacylglyceryl transferase [Neorickettsia sennetsu str. Miyayama]